MGPIDPLVRRPLFKRCARLKLCVALNAQAVVFIVSYYLFIYFLFISFTPALHTLSILPFIVFDGIAFACCYISCHQHPCTYFKLLLFFQLYFRLLVRFEFHCSALYRGPITSKVPIPVFIYLCIHMMSGDGRSVLGVLPGCDESRKVFNGTSRKSITGTNAKRREENLVEPHHPQCSDCINGRLEFTDASAWQAQEPTVTQEKPMEQNRFFGPAKRKPRISSTNSVSSSLCERKTNTQGQAETPTNSGRSGSSSVPTITGGSGFPQQTRYINPLSGWRPPFPPQQQMVHVMVQLHSVGAVSPTNVPASSNAGLRPSFPSPFAAQTVPHKPVVGTRGSTAAQHEKSSESPTAYPQQVHTPASTLHGCGYLNKQQSGPHQNQTQCSEDITPRPHTPGASPGGITASPVEVTWRRSSQMSRTKQQCLKTKLCHFFLEQKCSRGYLCLFAHSDEELRSTPDLSKTKICVKWKKGLCVQDSSQCNYAHGAADLRSGVARAPRLTDNHSPQTDIAQTSPKKDKGSCYQVSREDTEEHSQRPSLPFPVNVSAFTDGYSLKEDPCLVSDNKRTCQHTLEQQKTYRTKQLTADLFSTEDVTAVLAKQCDTPIPTTTDGSSSDEGSSVSRCFSGVDETESKQWGLLSSHSIVDVDGHIDSQTLRLHRRTRASTVDVVIPATVESTHDASYCWGEPIVLWGPSNQSDSYPFRPPVSDQTLQHTCTPPPFNCARAPSTSEQHNRKWESCTSDVKQALLPLTTFVLTTTSVPATSRCRKECDEDLQSNQLSLLDIHRVTPQELLRAMPCCYEE